MRSKACFDASVVRSDSFLDMPASAQLLYFQCAFEADGYGIMPSVRSVMRNIGSSNDDLNVLLAKGFLLQVCDCYVVRDWWRNNNKEAAKNMSTSREDIINCISYDDAARTYHLKGGIQPEVSLKSGGIQPEVSLKSGGIQPEVSLKSGGNVIELNRNEYKIIESNVSESNVSECPAHTLRAHDPCSGESDAGYSVEDVIDMYNSATGHNYSADANDTRYAIESRIIDGRSLGDFGTVIGEIMHKIDDGAFDNDWQLEPSRQFCRRTFEKLLEDARGRQEP